MRIPFNTLHIKYVLAVLLSAVISGFLFFIPPVSNSTVILFIVVCGVWLMAVLFLFISFNKALLFGSLASYILFLRWQDIMSVTTVSYGVLAVVLVEGYLYISARMLK